MASNLLKPVATVAPISREYSNLTGVDFMNEASRVALNRSPDALNIYKDYTKSGECIQTRPGHKGLANFESRINGLFFYEYNHGIVVLVHAGTKLYRWSNYPSDDPEDFIELFSNMNNNRSIFFVFDDNLFIMDGTNFLIFDGSYVQPVSNMATVPVTTMGREPSGGGEMYQAVNVITPKRRNSFVADGRAPSYVLDATNLDNTEVKAWVNGIALTENTDFIVDRTTGEVLFLSPPSAPALSGQDNVVIEFSKTISGYSDRIGQCTIAQIFDNRIFFSGNSDYPNAIFHSKLEDPFYISDLDYYQDGLDESAIKSMCVGNNLLWVFKESNQQNSTIFYHTPVLDSTNGKIYPSAQGNISIRMLFRKH